jgi:YD repeat-containing protein
LLLATPLRGAGRQQTASARLPEPVPAQAGNNAGNITSDTRSGTAYAYAYNKRNRLNTVTVAGSLKGTYTYNALEQLSVRVATNQTPSGTTHFIHDLFGNVIAETF